MFRTEDVQTLRTAVQILDATMTWCSGFVHVVLYALTTKGALRPAACGVLNVRIGVLMSP